MGVWVCLACLDCVNWLTRCNCLTFVFKRQTLARVGVLVVWGVVVVVVFWGSGLFEWWLFLAFLGLFLGVFRFSSLGLSGDLF